MTCEELLTTLTLEQKCALLSGADTFCSRALPGQGIPSLWLSDGPSGVRKQEGASDHLGINPSAPATCFPTAVTLAGSWDSDLLEEVGRAMGQEAAAQDVDVLLAPGLNIKRSPLCGRNFEYYSEDPILAGKLAAAMIRGIQAGGAAACPKHFAVNNQETRRMVSDSTLDERTLREIYLTGFEIAVKEGHPRTIMSSYNLVNGTYANENSHLLQEILREEWGFTGAVVTDWGGSNDHALGVKNGSTLEMPAPGGDAVRELLAAVRSGKITEGDIDARVEELLTLIEAAEQARRNKPKDAGLEEHHRLARRAAAEGMVLLKNEGGILPLDPAAKVAVIGDFADVPRYQGAGSSAVNASRVDTVRSLLAESGIRSVGYAQGFERNGAANPAKQAEAVALAGTADVVLLFLGLDELRESEGMDRADMRLARNQIDLLEAVAEVNPNTVVVLSAGAPVETPWLPRCKALLYGALGGQAGAGAALDLLTGRICPGGHLAETWPLRYEDTPAADTFAAPGRIVPYKEGLYVGYRYYQTADVPVAFPFGYGLSYTTFAWRDFQADSTKVTLTVENTGARDGAELVQVYVEKPDAKVFGPRRQLKAFQKVFLKAGESRTVIIPLDDKAFRYWNTAADCWSVEGGSYRICVGSSAEDIRLQTAVTLPGSGNPLPYAGLALPHYQTGDIRHVSDSEFETLLGRPLTVEKTVIDRNMTLGEIGRSRSPLAWLINRVHTALLRRSLQAGTPDLNLLFNYNMPLRAVAKMTNGMVSMGMVDALVMELKGFWIIGLVRLLVEFGINRARDGALERRLNAPAKEERL